MSTLPDKERIPRGLYGMLDLPGPKLPPPLPRHIYEPLFRAGVGILQLRMKGQSAAAMLAVLDELYVRKPKEALIFCNDRLDVALAGRADGLPTAEAHREVAAEPQRHRDDVDHEHELVESAVHEPRL